MQLDWLKTAKQFSVNSHKISLSVLSEQAVRQATTWPLVFLSQICRCFPAFKVVVLECLVLFVLAKCLMDFNKYFCFLLKFGATVFMYHSNTFTKHVSFCSSWNVCSILCRSFSSSFSSVC